MSIPEKVPFRDVTKDELVPNQKRILKFSEQKTLRDEFAMAALATLRNHGSLEFNQSEGDEVARLVYQMADALLNERNKGV